MLVPDLMARPEPCNLKVSGPFKAYQHIRRALPTLATVPRSTPQSKRGSLLHCNLSTPEVYFPNFFEIKYKANLGENCDEDDFLTRRNHPPTSSTLDTCYLQQYLAQIIRRPPLVRSIGIRYPDTFENDSTSVKLSTLK